MPGFFLAFFFDRNYKIVHAERLFYLIIMIEVSHNSILKCVRKRIKKADNHH